MDIDERINRKCFVFRCSDKNSILRFIHPLKQNNIANLLNNVPGNVEQIWVFGSAVSHNHYPWSDIDILCIGSLEGNDKEHILKVLDCPCDLIVRTKDEFRKYQNEFGHCFYQILRKGVRIYRKG